MEEGEEIKKVDFPLKKDTLQDQNSNTMYLRYVLLLQKY